MASILFSSDPYLMRIKRFNIAIRFIMMGFLSKHFNEYLSFHEDFCLLLALYQLR